MSDYKRHEMPAAPTRGNGYVSYLLARRMALYILIFSSLVTLFGTGLQLYIDYSTDINTIEKRFADIATSQVPNLVNNLWLTHTDAVRLQLQGIVELPDICCAVVKVTEGTELVVGSRVGQDELLVRDYPLTTTFRGQAVLLGRLEVAASLTGVYQRLWDKVLIILATQTAKTFIVSTFILLLFHRLVGRHLHTLAEYTRRVRLNQLPDTEPLNYYLAPAHNGIDELGQLFISIGEMVDGLRVSYSQLHTANLALEENLGRCQTMEQTLVQNELRQRRIIDSMPVLLVALDERGRIVFWNQECERVFGYRRAEVVNDARILSRILPDREYRARAVEMIRSRLGDFSGLELVMSSLEGNPRVIAWSDVSGQAPMAGWSSWMVGVDVTRRKQAEEQLREREQLLRSIIDNTQAVIFVKDLEGRYLLVNRRFEKLFGLTSAQVLGRCDTDFLPREVVHQVRANDQLALERHSLEVEEEIPSQEGGNYTFLALKFPLVNEQGAPWAVCGIATNITEIKRTQGQLDHELQVNRALARISHLLISTDYQIRDVAREVLNIALELTASQCGYVSEIDPDTRENLSHAVIGLIPQGEGANQGTIRFSPDRDGVYPGILGRALNDGKGFFLNESLEPPLVGGEGLRVALHGVITVPVMVMEQPAGQIALANPHRPYTDAELAAVGQLAAIYALAIRQRRVGDEKRQIERHLQQAQKLEAIGTLAGGVAHDFNNILSIIIGNSEYGLLSIQDAAKLREILEDIMHASIRGRDLVRQLLTFGRKSELNPKVIKPQQLFNETLQMLRATIPASITMQVDIQLDDGAVYCDPSQLQQVLINLCNNAVHAMARRAAPLLSISLQVMALDHLHALRLGVVPGSYYRLVVSDNGCGVPFAIRERIFDPFFTTKPAGTGTGLGLALVAGIVRESNGAIELESVEGEGSTFLIYLPIRFGWSADRTILPERVNHMVGQGRVMFIDDEPQLVKVITRMLQVLGFEVEGSSDPLDAVRRFGAAPGDYVAIITDQTMPDMTGVEVLRAIRACRTDIPVFLCTGFSSWSIEESIAAETGARILQKPLSVSDLRIALANLMSNSG